MPSTLNCSVTLPFSATQIIATGPRWPGTIRSMTNSPSSHMNSKQRGPRRWWMNSAMCFAPCQPPISSS